MKALKLLHEGKPSEAIPLLLTVAEDKARRADQSAKGSAGAYRDLAAIASLSEPRLAREYYAAAARLEPAHTDGMLQHAWYQAQAGQLDVAEVAYASVFSAGKSEGANDAVHGAHFGIGSIYFERGEFTRAKTHYRSAISQYAAIGNSNIADREVSLGMSYGMLSAVLIAEGELSEAFNFARESRDAFNRLDEADSITWRAYRARAYERLGDVLLEEWLFEEAIEAFMECRQLLSLSLDVEPESVNLQSQMAWCLSKAGDAYMSQDDLVKALAFYRSAAAAANRLVSLDPENGAWQREVGRYEMKLGGALVSNGNLLDGLSILRSSAGILERLAIRHPENLFYRTEFATAKSNVGWALSRAGQKEQALAAYNTARDIIALEVERTGSDKLRQHLEALDRDIVLWRLALDQGLINPRSPFEVQE